MWGEISSNISLVASIISIVLGGYAIYQANKTNKESNKINQDTKTMILLQTRIMEDIQKNIVRNIQQDANKINMEKDEFVLYKLKDFEENTTELVLKELENLSIKKATYRFIKDFLEDKSRNIIKVNFFYLAESKDKQEIEKIENNLIKYGILMQINYKALNNKN